MSIYADLVALLFDGGEKGSFAYSLLPYPFLTIKIRQTRHAGRSRRSRDELITNILLWTSSHGREKAGRPTRTYVLPLSADRRCSPEDLPEEIDDREGWRERVMNIRADSAI